MNKAIIETGGKQYLVTEGTELYIEKLDVEAGETLTFDQVLMVNGVAGRPYVKGATVTADVIKNDRAKKIIVFTYKAKNNDATKQGHRQPYTKVVIKSIIG